MPIITDCYEQAKIRIYIRRVSRGSYCPLHTKKIIDVFTTLSYPFKISHLKTKLAPTCAFKKSTVWRLDIKPRTDSREKTELSIRKYRAPKKK